MKPFFCLCLFILAGVVVNAQPARDSVIAAVNKLFEGMKKADTALLKNCFSPNAVLQTIKNDKGVTTVIDEKVADFIDFVGKESVGNADEQIVVETVKIDGPLAIVWTPYKFYYKGKFSHCGVNSFQLIRLGEGWKIQYIIDTRRKDACL
ncbi:MAG: nuclear transport factor 2 family protein [Ferruginibacter sp.]